MLRRIALTVVILGVVGRAPVIARDAAEALAEARARAAAGARAEAMEILHDALEAHPDDPEILLELGRLGVAEAREILSGAQPTLGRLAMLDAMRWLRRAVELKPDFREAHVELGFAATWAGDLPLAAEAYAKAVELDPKDGESRYQLGWALGTMERYEAAIEAFDAAEKLLGPDPRILLNRGIAWARLGRVKEAEASLVALVRAAAAGRGDMGAAQLQLWKLHSDREAFEDAARVFEELSGELPEVSGLHWYLGHARSRAGRPAEAAAAFARVTEILPAWPDGWAALGRAFVDAGAPEAARTSLTELLALAPDAPAASELLFAMTKAFAESGRVAEALALLDDVKATFAEDPVLLERRADLLFAAGRPAEAVAEYRAAAATAPWADHLPVKERKAFAALLRAGAVPEGLAPPAAPEPFEPRGEGGSILDFERAEVFARVNGGATGGREEGLFRLTRVGDRPNLANLSLTFVPEIDARDHVALRFTVTGPAGQSLRVRAQDCVDEFSPYTVRLTHRQVVELTGEAQRVELPLDGFDVDPRRPVPFLRGRLRALIFEIGAPPGLAAPDGAGPPAAEILLDDVALVPADGEAVPLADFDEEPAETIFLTTGAAEAFARTISRPEDLAGFRPDPNTFVNPAIFGEEFDPATVHGGRGSFRLTVAREGPAAATIEFNPDRSYEEASAFTFWAKGRLGEERVRVTFSDALDLEMPGGRPVSVPRLVAAGRAIEGWFTLTDEWKQYRIERAEIPDVHLQSLLRIAFEFGTPEGNGIGTTIYLDDVAWE